MVTDDQAAAFVARNRADGEPGFAIRPPGRRPVYYVTLFSYPRIPSSSSIGADARSDPGLLPTLERARDTGRTTVSNQTTLPGDLDLSPLSRPVAFELFVPVYRTELASDAPAGHPPPAVPRLGGRQRPAASATRTTWPSSGGGRRPDVSAGRCRGTRPPPGTTGDRANRKDSR